jgi:RES domain-containing protein
VYTSGSLALAALELLVHVGRDQLPDDLVQIEIGIPDDLGVHRIESGALPAAWRQYPAPEALQRLGDDWLAAGATPILRVPSAVIPDEDNCLINPEHPRIARVLVIGTRPFEYDARLGSRKRRSA